MEHGFDDATWADNRHHLTRSISDAIDKLSYAFRRLNALQYDAPWTRGQHGPRPHPRPLGRNSPSEGAAGTTLSV